MSAPPISPSKSITQPKAVCASAKYITENKALRNGNHASTAIPNDTFTDCINLTNPWRD